MIAAESREAHQQSRLLGTGASVGAHLLFVGLVLAPAMHAPQVGDTPAVPIAQFNPDFFKRGGLGRGGGGDRVTLRSRQVEIPPPVRREITAADNPQDITPLQLSIPVATIDAVKMLPGSATALDPTAPGRGSGPGGGAGQGPGSGGSEGPGLGLAQNAGSGGDAFDVGDGVAAPVLIREVKPAYTISAMRAKVQGVVELEVVVLPDGSVDSTRIRIVRSLDRTFGLDAQAADAVKQWRFRPGTYQNQPAPVRVRVELTFTLR